MPVLHVEDGIVEVALLREADVEVERHVAAPQEEEDARRVRAGGLEKLAQRDEVRSPFAHPVGLAVLHQIDELEEDDLQLRAHCLHRRLHARDIPAVVRAPYVDETLMAARYLVEVVGDVRCEVRRLAVRLEERAVALVAEAGGLHHLEGHRDVLLLVDVDTLRRRQHLLGNEALLPEAGYGLSEAICIVLVLHDEKTADAHRESL